MRSGTTWDDEGRETERWRQAAACRNMDTDLFFPRGETGVPLEQTVTAKAVCGGCPVRLACLEFAMATRQEYGIFGGLTEQERRSFLEGTWVAKLATHHARGTVRITPLSYAVEDGTIVFYTWEDSEATKNLRLDGRASVLIDDPTPPFKGVHYVGTADVKPNDRTPDALADAFARYSSRAEALGFYSFMETLGDHVLITFSPDETITWDLGKV